MTDIEAIRQGWKHFALTVKTIKPGDGASFRQVNQTLGYNVAQTVPILVKEIIRLDSAIDALNVQLAKANQTLRRTPGDQA